MTGDTLVAVQFVRNFGAYLRGEMTSIPLAELQRLAAAGVVVPVSRQQELETATAVPPEMAVTRRTRA